MTKITPYEQQRLDNIERNRQILAQFNIEEAKQACHEEFAEPTPLPTRISKRALGATVDPKPAKTAKTRISAPKIVKPKRQSSRLRGVDPIPFVLAEDDVVERGVLSEAATDAMGEELWDGKLLKPDDYFDKETCEKAIRTQGHFMGWINPALIEKYKFEMSASEAWEKNGGGKFSFTDPLNTKKKGNARVDAKAVAQLMFKKNPNMYFYRHNEPGVGQWTGDWTVEEKEMFLKVAREHGCGDKWGVFASYIPHRVGYQCSNFYRSELLPAGLIFDKNYEYTPSGRPIYVGGRRSGP
ncbi:hypothetical protein CLU79DRAFT_749560 [Phycomyces nitens]|nr:hypothetical protein CLU79DRAFT_749560 [Phycomyces nitens]